MVSLPPLVYIIFCFAGVHGFVGFTHALQVKAEGITGVTKVVGVSKLRAKFKQ
jgi:hypothetical protein